MNAPGGRGAHLVAKSRKNGPTAVASRGTATLAAPAAHRAAARDGASAAARIVQRGRAVIQTEREALHALEQRLDHHFADAVHLIARAPGRVIVAGVGKSGLVGRKIAATLTSTGTPATFLHPADSVHGDLGIVGTGDVAVLISKSGESHEVLALLEHLQRLGVRIIAVTGAATSTLASHADVVLDAAVDEEACPHDLAPTTSTTAAMAMGDALAVTLLQEKGFRREDFARLHPGGALGRQLLTRVGDVMVREDLPLAPPTEVMESAPLHDLGTSRDSHRDRCRQPTARRRDGGRHAPAASSGRDRVAQRPRVRDHDA